MPKRLSSLFVIFSLLMLFPRCATHKTSPVNYIAKHSFPPPREILEKIDLNHQGKDVLKTIAHIEVNTFRGRFPLKAAVMVKRPSSLRLEILPLLGPPELILSVHGNVLKVFLPQKGEFYIGQASGKNLGHFFPFPTDGLVIEDITSILFGTHPPIKEKPLHFECLSDEGLYRLDILSGEKKVQSLLIDIEHNTLMKVNLFDNDNNQRYMVKFFSHNVTENFTIPDTITLAYGNDEASQITIRYSDPQVTREVDEASFALQIPPNVKIISLD